ncbi:NAD(P)/FAD-dependent oxidoreductase [Halothermothrix orenii]|uniref:FAD-dependent pyridine nucleotide-disulphide oxidoreductase n=1 Tax=Halothermothrix orenii (strain H 168 / OCM 544 / DSM 9562) TaxID=373903 RepID=B8CW99_HALOH|nr:FAD-dependent oxidoreductase [Halothermothrix orenii]ACL69568.1 FAD-dependent pyridine nucleotide-disulphide oxidoreductase [Halothermothrix orenii H 168]
MYNYDLVVVGGGPAGLAAALEAYKNGVNKVLLLERDYYLGGILQQCIHNGFGLDYFKEELTGPEYAERFIEKLGDTKIKVMTETMVVRVTPDKKIYALNKKEGLFVVNARAIVLAMGCRERTREAIRIPGDRPAGIFTAGTAQRYINIEGYIPGREVVILGSGDIGLIMARRLTLEGARVKGVFEIMPYSSGLVRNKVQCLDDFNIPLYLKHTVIRIYGRDRVEKVTVARVDEKFRVIPGSEKDIKCDTLLLSVGLIPENELSKEAGILLDNTTGGPVVNEVRETDIEGIFACGNVLQVHDLVDYVTEEGEITGRAVSSYLNKKRTVRKKPIKLVPEDNVRYIVPHQIDYKDQSRKRVKLFMRVKEPMEKVRVRLLDPQTGNEIVSYPKPIVTPGEMVTVYLPEALIKENMDKIKISINKEEGGGHD